VINSEEPILVYSSKEFEKLSQITATLGERFGDGVGSSGHANKVFSLIPFFVEASFTDKFFVLRMQLYPKAGMLQFDTLTWTGVRTQYLPIKQLIPITKYDYWVAAVWRPFFKQN